MENLNSDNQIKNRKDGLTLLIISIGFSIISVIGLLWYSLARGCGYNHSFFLCSGSGIIFYFFLFINLILVILAVAQLIKPFFGEKIIKGVLVLYLTMILSVAVFDFFAVRIKSTELDCSLTGLYDKKNSEDCYFKLAQEKNDNSYCDKAGAQEKSCKTLRASQTNDVSYCQDAKCIKEIDIEKTFENLEIKIEPINTEIRKNTKDEKIAKIRITSKKYDGWISTISFEGSSNLTTLIISGSIKLYDEYGKLVSFGDYDNTGYLGIDIKPNTTKYLTIVANTADNKGVVSLGLSPIVSIYNPDNPAYANFNKFNLKPNNFVGIPEGYAQQPTHLRSKIELEIK